MRILHTMLRVVNIDQTLAFYTNVLGMRLLRRKDYPDNRFTVAFVGYGEMSEGPVLEITHNWDIDKYELGSGFGHIAIEVDDVYEATENIKKLGGEIVREAGPMRGGTKVLAFIKDPDGYIVEILSAV